jgi:hypothetical protein
MIQPKKIMHETFRFKNSRDFSSKNGKNVLGWEAKTFSTCARVFELGFGRNEVGFKF